MDRANSILGDFVLSIQKPLKVIGWLLQNGADANEMLINPNVKIIDFVKKARNNNLINMFEKYNPLFFKMKTNVVIINHFILLLKSIS